MIHDVCLLGWTQLNQHTAVDVARKPQQVRFRNLRNPDHQSSRQDPFSHEDNENQEFELSKQRQTDGQVTEERDVRNYNNRE